MSQSINLYNQLAKNKLFSKSINFDLKRIKLVLKKLNHPEKKLKNVINIIGSDGKYSLLTSLRSFSTIGCDNCAKGQMFLWLSVRLWLIVKKCNFGHSL